MRAAFYILARRLLQALRRARAYYRPLGPLLYRDIDGRKLVVQPVGDRDVALLEAVLASGDPAKHRERLIQQQEGVADYLIAWAIVPVGHLQIIWSGGEDGPLRERAEREPLIEDVYVHPAARGRGVGERLMDEAERRVAARGHGRVGLSVATSNPGVERMYRRRGYRDAGVGTFESRRVFTDTRGRRKAWSATMRYLVKEL